MRIQKRDLTIKSEVLNQQISPTIYTLNALECETRNEREAWPNSSASFLFFVSHGGTRNIEDGHDISFFTLPGIKSLYENLMKIIENFNFMSNNICQ